MYVSICLYFLCECTYSNNMKTMTTTQTATLKICYADCEGILRVNTLPVTIEAPVGRVNSIVSKIVRGADGVELGCITYLGKFSSFGAPRAHYIRSAEWYALVA